MLHRSLIIPFHALCLLPALALAGCDPNLNLGELFGDENGDEGGDDQGDEGDQGGDDQGDEGDQGGDDQGDQGGDDQGDEGDESQGDESTGEPPEPGCDVWAQDCPVGEKCTPYDDEGVSWDALKCVPIDPVPVPVGGACENPGAPADGIDDCEEGAICWDVDPSGAGTCVAHCQGSEMSPSCDAGFTCLIANDGVLTLCLPDCDPLLQNCDPGNTCIPAPESFACVLDASGTAGQAFDACEFANACDPGLICADSALASECDPMAPGCCLPFCDLDVSPDICPGSGQDCVPWYAMGTAPVGQEHLGLCGLP